MIEEDFLLNAQSKLFKFINSSIITEIINKPDKTGKFLIAKNIEEKDIPSLEFITNSPQYKTYMYFVDIQCFLSPNGIPQLFTTPIYGLTSITRARIDRSDTEAFRANKTTHHPFENGFKNGISIGELVDNLTSLSRDLPNTFGVLKTFTIIMDPPLTPSDVPESSTLV
jgi:hypothetical protein